MKAVALRLPGRAIGFDTLLPAHRLTCSFFQSIHSPTPIALASCETDDDFVEMLRRAHEFRGSTKESNYLFSPAIFDPNLAKDTKRGRANIVHLRNVVLDFENGDLQSEELTGIFPGLRMLVTNTFNHTPDRPRYRAIIPTSENMTADVYHLICECLAETLEDAGCSVRKWGRDGNGSNMRPSGLDWSKTFPHSLFYLPCRAQNPSHSFFLNFGGPSRSPINPSTWLENIRVPLQPEPETALVYDEMSQGSVNEELVQDAVNTWRSSAHPGQGNEKFFNLALSLRRAGMSHHEIERTLRAEAQFGRTPSERLAQIRSIMVSLRKSFVRFS